MTDTSAGAAADAPQSTGGGPNELVALDAYRRAVLARVGPLDPIELGLLEAHGCVLAADVVATDPVPGFDRSAMDGFAVRSADVEVGRELVVGGEVAAGAAGDARVTEGRVVRIMTGAPIPLGADAVIPVEASSEAGGKVRFSRVPEAGEHVRAAGEDVSAGEPVLRAGRRLGAADVGMLAAIGRARVPVRPKPRVVVVSTGDELREPDAALGPGQIRDANSYTLTACVREAGATAYRQPIVADNRRALQEVFEGALAHADLLLTSGGVSAGRYDLVKEVLGHMGDVEFRRVGMQPGMPQAFGFVGSVPCFGLPGNPVSAFVSFEVFVRPVLRRMQGRTDTNRPRVTAFLDTPVTSPPAKVSFMRVKLRRADGLWHATPTGAQGSGILRSVVDADGLAEVPAERTTVEAGERLVVHLLLDAS